MDKTPRLFSTQFLPYDLNSKNYGDIKVGLKEYVALLKAFIEAIRYFRSQDLTYFDSLVGENACEIRAAKLSIMASKQSLDLQNLENKLSNSLVKVKALLVPNRIKAIMRGQESLQSIVKSEDIDIILSPEECFILHSYLLTIMKADIHKDINSSIFRVEASDPKKFKRFGDISISFAKKLLSHSRRYLATVSVQFIQEIALAHQEPALLKMVSNEFVVKHNTLPCIPMFWTYKAIITEVQREKIPLILHVKFLDTIEGRYQVSDEDCLLFDLDHSSCYVEVGVAQSAMNKVGWVVQGIVTVDQEGYLLTKEEWRENIKQTPVVDVILAGAADHRQYPDPFLDSRIEVLQDPEFTKYRSIARAHGFSSENPTTFFIQHVYAAHIKAFFKSTNLEYKEYKLQETKIALAHD